METHQMSGYFKNHWHNYYEITYYDNCRGTQNLNGQEYEIKGNCLFLLTPKDFHEINTKKDPDARSYLISFTEQAPDKQILGSLTKDPIVLYDVPISLTSKIKEMFRVFNSAKKMEELYLRNLLNCILIEILEKGTALPYINTETPDIIRDAIFYIMSNPDKEITLKNMAAKAGLSSTYFSELFHKNTGITFKKYLTQIRI